ncbi:MAG: hypothetical protein H6816_04255 [Phycisphaerales bacterium]|nr:hypothetical protein [Phycisphaerales bacterium]
MVARSPRRTARRRWKSTSRSPATTATSTARRKARKKTGEFTGAYATNPVNGKEIPIWVADYVLMGGYGTSTSWPCPLGLNATQDFARVRRDPYGPAAGRFRRQAYLGEGPAIHSDYLDGLGIADAKQRCRPLRGRRAWSRGAIATSCATGFHASALFQGESRSDPARTRQRPRRPRRLFELPRRCRKSDYSQPYRDEEHLPIRRWARPVKSVDRNGRRTMRANLNTMPQWAGSCWPCLRFIDPANAEAFLCRRR